MTESAEEQMETVWTYRTSQCSCMTRGADRMDSVYKRGGIVCPACVLHFCLFLFQVLNDDFLKAVKVDSQVSESQRRTATMSSKSSLLKVILLGDGGVGKSSLMNRYVTNKFDSHLFHTIGVEFLNKDLEVDGRTVTLQIWDTAGQERFRSLRTPFYRGSDCCLLTFSVDDGQSFRNLANWKKEFVYYADVKDPDAFPFVVLGNKVDVSERQVSRDEALQWCRDNGDYAYYETSAKDATNVSAAFEEAVRRVLATEERTEHLIPTDTVNLHRKPRSGAPCC